MTVISETTVSDWLEAAGQRLAEFGLGEIGGVVFMLLMGCLIILALLAVAALPLLLIGGGQLVEGEIKKPGSANFGMVPASVSLLAAIRRAIPVTYELWSEHAGWYVGVDLTDKAPFSFPWSSAPKEIPAEIALCFSHLGTWWYVPLAVSAIVVVLGIRGFRKVSDAFFCLVIHVVLSLVVYWFYGMFLAFVLLPTIIGALLMLFGWVFLIGAAKDAVKPEYSTAQLEDGTTLTKREGLFGEGWKDSAGNTWKKDGADTFRKE